MSRPDISALSVPEIVSRYTFGTWRPQKGFKPMHITKAEGVYFYEASGKRFLDMSAQLMCSNLGHQNEAVVEAICKQARDLCFIAPGHATTVRAKLTEALLDVVPEGLEKFFYATSGTEANEAAVKIARFMTGKQKIISRYNSYHGSTASAMALTGDWRRWLAEPVGSAIPHVIHGPECNPYRPEPFKSASDVIDYYDYMLRNEGNVAAMIVEPIVGTNGVLVPPDDYFPRLRALCDKYGILLIADEVMSGWGRAGKWFAIQNWNVTPDILVTAKGVTSAMAPLGVVAVTRKVADHFEDNWFAHGHTYESHPLTLAPAVAAIAEYKRLNLIERSAQMESVFRTKLEALKARHPSVGDVRGKGMFWGIELVKDRTTKEPFGSYRDKIDRKPLVIDQVVAKCAEQGVSLVGWISHLVLAPPLILTESQLDECITALDVALTITDALAKG